MHTEHNAEKFVAQNDFSTDDWHSHGLPGEAAPQRVHGELHPGWILAGLLVSMVGLVVTVGLVVLYFHHEANHMRNEQVEVSLDADFIAMREQAQSELNTYGWVNQEQGVVRAPVTQAMDDVIEWYQSNTSNP